MFYPDHLEWIFVADLFLLKSPLYPRLVAIKDVSLDTNDLTDEFHFDERVAMLTSINKLDHHHIVKFITAFKRKAANSLSFHLVYEFANEGNLQQTWEALKHDTISFEQSQWAITQICGLASALNVAHHPLWSTNTYYYHTDLKPESILCFDRVLKIGKLESMKRNDEVLQLDSSGKSDKLGSKRYEAPEVFRGLHEPDSFSVGHQLETRLCNIWSMGCIILEFLIWLCYDTQGLEVFQKETAVNEGCFYIPFKQSTIVNPVIIKWMDDMEQSLVVQQTVLKHLLLLVKNQLLVFTLPRQGVNQNPTKYTRYYATELFQAMDLIRRRHDGDKEEYWKGSQYLKALWAP